MIDSKLTKEQSERFWNMAYSLCDNIKTYMDSVYKEKNGNITDKEINELEDYHINSWNEIVNILFCNKQ